MKLFLFAFFITLQIYAGNSFEDFISQGTPLDLNNDGVADLVKKKISEDEQVITFTPSWDFSFQKVTTINPQKTDIKKFRKGMLFHHMIEVKSVDTERIVESIEYSNFIKGKALKMVKTKWSLEDKEITHYQKINNSWGQVKKQSEKIDVFFQGIGGCETNILPLSEPATGIFGGLYNFLNFSKHLHPTTIGLRIDSDSCSEKAISQFDAAIDKIFNQYLPCLSKKRPALAERIITGLQANQNRVYCQEEGKGRAGAYTNSKPDADIVFLHHTINGFNRNPAHFADMLFHEILHHHFKTDNKLHNHGDVKDPVYGCTSLCSGFEADDLMTMEFNIFRGYSVEGCEACLNSPFLDGSQGEVGRPSEIQCRENPIISLINRCESLLDESDCRNRDYVRKANHPNFQKCLAKGVEAKDCLWLDIYSSEYNFESSSQFFDHPNFKLCLSKASFQSDCMKDIQYLDSLNDPEVLRCMELAPKDEKTYCFYETLRKKILNSGKEL